jgi:hypothetical protein
VGVQGSKDVAAAFPSKPRPRVVSSPHPTRPLKQFDEANQQKRQQSLDHRVNFRTRQVSFEEAFGRVVSWRETRHTGS